METSTLKKATLQASVIAVEPLPVTGNRHNYLMTMKLGRVFEAFPGQFIQIRLADLPAQPHPVLEYREDTLTPWPDVQPNMREKSPLLNRPFSIAGLSAASGFSQLSVIYNVKGPGTLKLSRCRPGETLTVLGPLGHRGFSLPEQIDRVVIVAGGMGLAPMLYWSSRLVQAKLPMTLLIGAQAAAHLPLPEAVHRRASDRQSNIETVPDAFKHLLDRHVDIHLATDDGSAGTRGLVTTLLETFLTRKRSHERWIIYSCGPWAMLRSVANQARRATIPCQVSLEQMMACGIGTCQSCIVKTHSPQPPSWQYELCCTDGPVFDAESVIWD
jgi:dihydroorotate dehydrogenase electron transfer subunit